MTRRVGEQPTKVILLTPPGGAAIAVVRVAGPGVRDFLARHFTKPGAVGRCVYGTLSDGPRVVDDPVVVLHPGGAVADVNVHGGPWVVRSVLELARREGFEVVEQAGPPLPDEAADASTVLGREVLRYVPVGRTELAVRVLLAQEGAWDGFKRSAPSREELERTLGDCSLHFLLHPPRVAIVGAPNVGKSTLANGLFAQERSITADLPGTTRDWVGEVANVDGLAVMLVDTPGLRQTADRIEREAIERSRPQVEGADLVLVVLDPSQARGEQGALVESHRQCFRHVLYVANKADLPSAWEAPEDATWVSTVATKGEGLDRLRREIKRHFLGSDALDVDRARWWTGRQQEILRRALVDPAALSEV